MQFFMLVLIKWSAPKMAYFRYLPGHSHDWRSMDRQGICAWAGLLAAPYGWLLFLQA